LYLEQAQFYESRAKQPSYDQKAKKVFSKSTEDLIFMTRNLYLIQSPSTSEVPEVLVFKKPKTY
jgi:hypothetical protein